MRSKTLISTIVLAGVLATSMSTSAFAEGGRHRGHGGNNGVAIAAGVLGALAIGSIIANANAGPVYSAPSYYQQPAQTYYEAPQQYYQPAPQPQVYYQPAPVYYQPQPAAVYVEGGGWRGRHHRQYYGY